MSGALARRLTGDAVSAMAEFYARLPRLPRGAWPDLLVAMGYNFEFYDGLFALMSSHVQLSMEDCGYTARYRAMQALLRPFSSEYGIEAGRRLMKTHRELYAEFYRKTTGRPLPERYPKNGENPYMNVSRRWAKRMADSLACPGGDADLRAKFSLGYHWTVEHLSAAEFRSMKRAWERLGVRAPYLDSHCAVERKHAGWASRAVLAFARAGDPVVGRAVRAHEAHLAGYYRDMTAACARP